MTPAELAAWLRERAAVNRRYQGAPLTGRHAAQIRSHADKLAGAADALDAMEARIERLTLAYQHCDLTRQEDHLKVDALTAERDALRDDLNAAIRDRRALCQAVLFLVRKCEEEGHYSTTRQPVVLKAYDMAQEVLEDNSQSECGGGDD